MTSFITQRADVTSATYQDEYLTSAGWQRATRSYPLADSDTRDYLMISNLGATSVRVRATAFVTTVQGPSC